MDAGAVFPVEGLNKQKPPNVSVPVSGDITESINRPSYVDERFEKKESPEIISAVSVPELGSDREKGRNTKPSYGRSGSQEGSRPADIALCDVTPGSDLGPGIEVDDLPLGMPGKRDSMASDISLAGSVNKESDLNSFLSQSQESMDTEVPKEGVPTGASGFGAGTRNLGSEIHDSGVGGIRSGIRDATNVPAGLSTGVDPARETMPDIPTGAQDVFEPRPDESDISDENIDTSATYMGEELPGSELQFPVNWQGNMLDPSTAPVQGSFKTHSLYKDIPVPSSDPIAALPPETAQTLIAPVLESLNQAGAPRAHIQHIEQVIYSADDVPGIGHVEGTVERITMVDQTPNFPPMVQSGFVKPREDFGLGSTNQTNIRGD